MRLTRGEKTAQVIIVLFLNTLLTLLYVGVGRRFDIGD